ncbi:unnamed protein product [Urochloa decumbens]|uniref:Uncharacterized protein n=1 Tax=Urochloa decumbens TaxID=240449 RepID=A0ABC9F299_9POAL
MEFTFPATTTTTTTPEQLPPATAGPAPLPAACRQLPLPRLTAARPPWFPPSPPPAVPTRATAAVVMPEEEPPENTAGTGPGGDAAAASAAAEAELEERMDMLWEDFNEELSSSLAARRRARARGGSWRDDRGLEGPSSWSEEEPSPAASEAESEPAAARAGCGPLLRPSARAAAGARHCRRRAGRWVLLMRIFRRLFVVEKTISAVPRQRSTTRAR